MGKGWGEGLAEGEEVYGLFSIEKGTSMSTEVRTKAERDETGWLIEDAASAVSAPMYVFLSESRLQPTDWTRDHNKALRFARKQDATAFAHQFLELASVRIAEHGWSN